MQLHSKPRSLPAEIVCDPEIMGGMPTVRGTRVPAATIVAYLRAGHTRREIFEDYPSLPADGIDAIIEWADRTLGAGWRDKQPAH